MNNNASWKITAIEYCFFKDTAISQVLYGEHNKGVADLPANVTLIQGYGHNILVDVGFRNNTFIESHGAKSMLLPDEYLKIVALKPEDIDLIFLSHLHFDHVGNIDLFPNAKVYVQRCELEGWLWAMTFPPKFEWITGCIDSNDIINVTKIAAEGRLVLVDEKSYDVLSGISLHIAKGHTFGSQVVSVETGDGVYVVTGDAAYSLDNIKKMIPMGYGFDQIDQLFSFDLILKLAKDDINHIIPGHDLNWPSNFSSTKKIDNLPNRITIVTDSGRAV